MSEYGVILINTGGPESLGEIENFLYNLFLDPEIIHLPIFFRKPLAKTIANIRTKKVVKWYQEIGGKSPMLEMTQRQKEALEITLRKKGVSCQVFIGMRYSSPFIADAYRQLTEQRIEKVILFPLYPQYSKTTTGSSLKVWQRVCKNDNLKVKIIHNFYHYPLYLSAITSQIKTMLGISRASHKVHLIFSAHGVPVKMIEQGDPYLEEIKKTVELIVEYGKFSLPYHLGFQSKIGLVKWLTPTLEELITELVKEKVEEILIIPVSFVTDNLETLYELGIRIRKFAVNLGIKNYAVLPGLNFSPLFIETMSALILDNIKN